VLPFSSSGHTASYSAIRRYRRLDSRYCLIVSSVADPCMKTTMSHGPLLRRQSVERPFPKLSRMGEYTVLCFVSTHHGQLPVGLHIPPSASAMTSGTPSPVTSINFTSVEF